MAKKESWKTIRETADIFGVSHTTVQNWIAQYNVPTKKRRVPGKQPHTILNICQLVRLIGFTG